jgi:hypothetical protein
MALGRFNGFSYAYICNVQPFNEFDSEIRCVWVHTSKWMTAVRYDFYTMIILLSWLFRVSRHSPFGSSKSSRCLKDKIR